MSKHRVTLWPSGKVIEVDSRTCLKEAMESEGLYVDNNCGGHAVCGKCVIRVIQGEENLSPVEFKEKSLLGNVFHLTKERLSCQTYVKGIVTIDRSKHDELTPKKSPEVRVKKKAIIEEKPLEDAPLKESTEEKKETKMDLPKKLGGNRRPRPFKT